MIYPHDISDTPIGTRCHVSGVRPFTFNLVSKKHKGRNHIIIQMQLDNGNKMEMRVKKTFVVAW